MVTKLDPHMEAAVAAYAEHMYESDQTSNENKEELHRQREINEEVSEQYQWVKPEEYADFGARIGRIMDHAEFITLLRKAGVESLLSCASAHG